MAEASGTELDVDILMEEFDRDGDGVLNQEETHAAMESLKEQMGTPPNGGPGAGGGRHHLRRRRLPGYMARTALKVSPPSTSCSTPCLTWRTKKMRTVSSRHGYGP